MRVQGKRTCPIIRLRDRVAHAAIGGHALAKTYAVLTRLPGDLRLAPGDAARRIATGCRPARLRYQPRPALIRLEVVGVLGEGLAAVLGDQQQILKAHASDVFDC
jgi:hypothetical protein